MINNTLEEARLVTVGKKPKSEFPIESAFVHEYKLRKAGVSSNTVEVSVPRDFIRRLAKEDGLPFDEFIRTAKVEVYYGGGDELLYKFIKGAR